MEFQLALYIEGVLTPVAQATISQTGATFTLQHHIAALDLPPFSHVQFFVIFRGEEILFFDGFIIGLAPSSILCSHAYDILSFTLFGMIDPASFVLNQTAQFMVQGQIINVQGSITPLTMPGEFFNQGISNSFNAIYDFFLGKDTETRPLIAHNITPFYLSKKVKVLELEAAQKLLSAKFMETIMNGLLSSRGDSVQTLKDLIASIYNIIQYRQLVVFNPPKLDLYNLFAPIPIFLPVPKCNILTSPIVDFRQVQPQLLAAQRITRLTYFTQIPGAYVPAAVIPEKLIKETEATYKFENFHKKLTDEEEKQSIPVISAVQAIPWELVSVFTEESTDPQIASEFIYKLAARDYEIRRASTTALQFQGGYHPYLIPNFPVLIEAINKKTYIGFLSSLNFSIGYDAGATMTGTVSPVWELPTAEKSPDPIYPDYQKIIKELYKEMGTAELKGAVPSSVLSDQEAFYRFTKRKTVSLNDFLKAVGGKGTGREYDYPGLNKNRKKQVKRVVEVIRNAQ